VAVAVGVDPKLGAIGRLIGLLTGPDDDIAVSSAWFGDPLHGLEGVPTRLGEVANLASEVLGPGAASPPAVFPDAQWYPIPNPDSGGLTALHVAAPPPGAASGELGLGLLAPELLGGLSVVPYVYVPLFSFDSTGAHFVPGSTSEPCQVGLDVTAAAGFSVDGVTFSALRIDAGIFLAAEAPTFTLVFEGLEGTSKPSTYHSLADLLDPDVLAWLGEVVVQGTPWLVLCPGNTMTSVGDILVAAGFLTKDSNPPAGPGPVYHLDLQNLQGTGEQIALDLAFAALNALVSIDDPLITLPGGGIYVAHDATTDDYGIRVAAELTIDVGQTANGQAPAAVDLCLGTWFTGETDTDNWMQRTSGAAAAPGLSLLLLHRDGETLSFTPHFALTSVGVDVKGGGGAPLVNVDGYTLGGVEARASLDSAAWAWGVGARLDAVGFPLGPAFQDARAGGSGNAVAQSLLASGGGGSSGGPTNAVNPAFSAEAAYADGHFLLELFDAQGNPTNTLWFPIQSRFGPVECEKIGVQVEATPNDPVVRLVVDGGVSLTVLAVDLDELSIGVHLKEPTSPSSYDLDLQGMAVSFDGGGVQISGGLLETKDAQGWVAYDGEALIRFEDLAIQALGSFGSLPTGGTSLFVFAWLNAPLGGPPFFYVTGLSAGFGYNRALQIPTQSQVQDFPLVSGLTNPALVGGDPAQPQAAPDPGAALATLEEWVPPERGEYWLAAGIQFTTFEIVNSNALLVVEFGADFVIAVLGVATLKQPQAGETYVYAQLDLEVVFRPEEGELLAAAVLAPGSYLLTQEAHLTGGFAFAAWFGANAHAGDWVFTIGGYHPAFKAPSYYPQEPRVGIDWVVSSTITLLGEAYFAITPAAMMAGADIALTFADGALKAWLKVQFDAILFWKPYYVVADATISIGVSYHLHVLFVNKTISVELTAELDFWGPPVGFKVHVDWYVISFTITHGSPSPPASMTWDEFKGMLPQKTQAQPALALAAAAGPGAATTATTTAPAYLSVVADAGLIRQLELEGVSHWLVRPGRLSFSVASAVPASKVVVQGSDGDHTVPTTPVAIRGVGGGISSQDYQSTQTIAILGLSPVEAADLQPCLATTSSCTVLPSGCTAGPISLAGWNLGPVVKELPQALWGDPVPKGQTQPPLDADGPTVTGTVGATLTPAETPAENCTPEMVIAEVFEDRVVNPDDAYLLPLSQQATPAGTPPQPADSFADIAHVEDPDVVAARSDLFTALQLLAVNAWTNDPLEAMAATPGLDFADEPLEGAPA
jgi:hypothetical protein